MAIYTYPLSTTDGKAIPNEIANPSSAYRLLVQATAMGIPLAITPVDGAICQVRANKVMLLGTGATVLVPGDVAYGVEVVDAMWLEPHKLYTVWVQGAALSAITKEGSAELLINVFHGWDLMASEGQIYNG